jgi:hypothetical protein
MNSERPIRLSVVYEFAGQPDHMMQSLLDGLQELLPGIRFTFLPGLIAKYRPGGLRPERLLNLAWVYLRVAVHLLFRRTDAVLVHTAPPGIQLWAVSLATVGKVPVFCWLMDYHPEIEARRLERHAFGIAARLLRGVDARLMPRFALIIALDPAMAALARARSSPIKVLEHPTWGMNGTAAVTPVSYNPARSDGSLRLAYSGNLGAAHDLDPLRRLLAAVAIRRPVCLCVIGASPAGEGRFRDLCAELGLSVEMSPRVPFSELRGLYEARRINAGIVLLSEESAGLASPSKFSGYINFGLPFVYLGPSGTNAATVCLQYNGGFWLPPRAGSAEIDFVAAALLDEGRMASAAAGARTAAEHFAGFNGRSLAKALAPHVIGNLP